MGFTVIRGSFDK